MQLGCAHGNGVVHGTGVVLTLVLLPLLCCAVLQWWAVRKASKQLPVKVPRSREVSSVMCSACGLCVATLCIHCSCALA